MKVETYFRISLIRVFYQISAPMKSLYSVYGLSRYLHAWRKILSQKNCRSYQQIQSLPCPPFSVRSLDLCHECSCCIQIHFKPWHRTQHAGTSRLNKLRVKWKRSPVDSLMAGNIRTDIYIYIDHVKGVEAFQIFHSPLYFYGLNALWRHMHWQKQIFNFSPLCEPILILLTMM